MSTQAQPPHRLEVEVEAEENHLWLVGEFVRLLLRHEPRSVLDVGCGAGRLLRACRAAGVEAAGVDQPGPKLEALKAEGFDAREGTAYALEVPDRSVDWVTLRHVPHHLEDPPRAFAEALRVARRGVLVAEPWFDVTLASQRSALAFDRWEKRQHRRAGRFHAENLELDALLAALPAECESGLSFEVARHLRPRGRSIEKLAREATELVADDPEDHPERQSLRELLDELKRTGLSWNGSLCLALERW